MNLSRKKRSNGHTRMWKTGALWISSPHYKACIMHLRWVYNYFYLFFPPPQCVCVCVCVCVCSHVSGLVLYVVFLRPETCSWEQRWWYIQWCPAALNPNWSQSSRHLADFKRNLSRLTAPSKALWGDASPHLVTVGICLWFTLPPSDLSFPRDTFWSIGKTNVYNLGLTPLWSC